MIHRKTFVLSLCALLFVAACDDNDDATPIDPGPFAEVDAAARAAFYSAPIDGMGLSISGRDGTQLFAQTYGDFTPDRRVPSRPSPRRLQAAAPMPGMRSGC